MDPIKWQNPFLTMKRIYNNIKGIPQASNGSGSTQPPHVPIIPNDSVDFDTTKHLKKTAEDAADLAKDESIPDITESVRIELELLKLGLELPVGKLDSNDKES